MKRHIFLNISYIFVVCIIFLISGCSGGGGDDGVPSTGEQDSSGRRFWPNARFELRRSDSTGIRLIHASIDAPPLNLRVVGDEQFSQASRFLQPTAFRKVAQGSLSIVVEQANTPGVVLGTVPVTLAEGFEYSLIASGEIGRDTFRYTLNATPIERPEAGFVRVQFIHGLSGFGKLTMSIAGAVLGPIARGEATDLVVIPQGVQSAVVQELGGAVLSRLDFPLADRSEASFILAGSKNSGAKFFKVFEDLD